MFDRAIAKAEQLISKIDTINDLLTEEMMYDYDTGQLTDMGALSLTLNAQSMNDSLDTLQNYVKKRQQIIDDYNNKLFGEQKYDELMSENDSNIQNALKNANSYKQQILSIVKTQSQKEQDALFKVIDARKEALKKKKEYYDYDKQLKSKTKEINLLQQQIDALDGVTDAESRAQKARLEAQLKDAQDDLDDTVRDHVYDLQVDGLDDLEDQLKEDLEKWSNELSGNLDKMSKAINNAINNSGASAADAMNTLAEVLKQFNITPDQLGIILTVISMYFDRPDDMGVALHMMKLSVTRFNPSQILQIPAGKQGTAFTPYALLILAVGCVILFVVSVLQERGMKIRESLAKLPLPVTVAVYFCLLVSIGFFGSTAVARGFIYAQF